MSLDTRTLHQRLDNLIAAMHRQRASFNMAHLYDLDGSPSCPGALDVMLMSKALAQEDEDASEYEEFDLACEYLGLEPSDDGHLLFSPTPEQCVKALHEITFEATLRALERFRDTGVIEWPQA